MSERVSRGSQNLINLEQDEFDQLGDDDHRQVSSRPQSPSRIDFPSDPASNNESSSSPVLLRHDMHKVIDEVVGMAAGRNEERRELLQEWRNELLAVIEPRDNPNLYYERNSAVKRGAYGQITLALFMIRWMAEEGRMVVRVSGGFLGLLTGEIRIDKGCTADWLIVRAKLGNAAKERLYQYRHAPLIHARRFRINPHEVSNRNYSSTSQSREPFLSRSHSHDASTRSHAPAQSPSLSDRLQALKDEALKRQQEVHDYVDDLCKDALKYSEGNRLEDEKLLKKWKGELFAIIEPLGKPLMNYSPDGAGYLEHYRLLCDTLRMINQNAKSLIVPVYSRGGPLGRQMTSQRQIAPAYTPERLIQRLDLEFGTLQQLERYRRLEEQRERERQQHSIGSNETRRISRRMAQISRFDTIGPASRESGGLLF